MSRAQSALIRPARLADALAIAALHHAAVHQLAASHYPPEVLDRWSPPVTLARAEQLYRQTQDEGGQTLVAERNREIAGFGVVMPVAGEISACYVAPELSREGIGRLLLAAMETAIATAGVHKINVRVALNAKSFYSAFGYHVSSRGEHGFDDGTRMVVAHMCKDTTPLV